MADLHEGYETSRRMLRRYDPTYYLATRRLPAAVRPATYALYGYVRMADQLVDGPHRPGTPAARRAALDAWEAELQAPSHPIARALDDAAARHALPLGELTQYMRSMRLDCDGPVRIGSWEELQAYMDGSAGTVGRTASGATAVAGPLTVSNTYYSNANADSMAAFPGGFAANVDVPAANSGVLNGVAANAGIHWLPAVVVLTTTPAPRGVPSASKPRRTTPLSEGSACLSDQAA